MQTHSNPNAPALITAAAAADRLGLGVKRFKAAVTAGELGGLWLVEIGSECYVHSRLLEHFICGEPAPASPADLFR
ncbi:hypothetical protein WKW80_05235 [Variovorax humicola]|uniref:DNA-binding protein n=1 Tax=Variovorax humicola TaxID=1769758 RepID=A0ABU8VUF3_9BURK